MSFLLKVDADLDSGSIKLFNLILLFVFLFMTSVSYDQLLYSETFDEGNDAVSGTDDQGNGVAWTSLCDDCLPSGDPAGSDDFFKIVNGKLSGQDTNGPAVFETDDIDISTCSGNLEISFDIEESGDMEDCGTGCNSADWIQLEYSYDGGNTWEEPSNAYFCLGPCADNNVIVSGNLTGVVNYNSGCINSGSTIKLRITVQSWAGDEVWMIDNIEVNCVPVVPSNFNPVADICSGTNLTALPTSSTNGVSGTWSPALDNTQTTTYTFTPDPGQCASSSTLTIVVNPVYNMVQDTVVCQGESFVYPDGSSETINSNTNHVSNLVTQGSACDSIITTNVIMTNGTVSTFDTVLCVGQDYTYADGTVALNVQSNQSHTSTFSVGSNCDSVVTENIIIGTTIPLNLIVSEPLCYGQSNGSVIVDVTSGNIEPGAIIEITNDQGIVLNQNNSNAAELLPAGWYYCSVDNPNVCDGLDSVFLNQPDSLYFSVGSSNPNCTDYSDGEAWIASVNNAQGPYSVAWNGVLGTDTINTLSSGNHSVILVDSMGCTSQNDFTLVDPSPLVLGELTSEPSQCRGNGIYSGSGTLSATATGGTGTKTYLWTNGIDSSITSTWGNRESGWYTILVTDANNCIVFDSVYVDSLNPIADFTVDPDFGYTPLTVIIEDNSSNRKINSWFFNDTVQTSLIMGFDSLQTPFDSIFTELGNNSVCLMVSNDYECYDTLCKNIQVNPVPSLTIPNVITPNADGVNDEWNPFKNNGLESIKYTIVNRWGVKVFESNSLSTPFVGRDMNGKILSEGVYHIIYEAIGLDQVDYSGQGVIHLIK